MPFKATCTTTVCDELGVPDRDTEIEHLGESEDAEEATVTAMEEATEYMVGMHDSNGTDHFVAVIRIDELDDHGRPVRGLDQRRMVPA